MDVMDHHQRVVPRLMKSQRKTNTKSNKKKSSSSKNSSLKVVYISSPMKVQTSPSRFMSLVQELTGKNSDIAHYMEANNDGDVLRDFYDDRALIKETTSDEHQGVFSSISSEDTPTSSDSFLGPIDDVFISQIDEQFGGIFSSNSLSQCEMDVLGSYDELL